MIHALRGYNNLTCFVNFADNHSNFSDMKTVKVVGAVITDKAGRILAAQKPYSEISYKSYKWEFPPGNSHLYDLYEISE